MGITKEWVAKKKKELEAAGLPPMVRKVIISGGVYVIRPITYAERLELETKHIRGGEIAKLETDPLVKRYNEIVEKVRTMILETLQAQSGGHVNDADFNKYMADPELILSGRNDWQAIKEDYYKLTTDVAKKLDEVARKATDAYNVDVVKKALLYPNVNVDQLPAFVIELLADKILEYSGQIAPDDIIIEDL